MSENILSVKTLIIVSVAVVLAIIIIIGVSLFNQFKNPQHVQFLVQPNVSIQPSENVLLNASLVYAIGECKNNSKDFGVANVKKEGKFLNLTYSLNYVCCAKPKLYLNSIRVINPQYSTPHPNQTYLRPYPDHILIKLTIKNEGGICRCVCDYNINAKIGPFETLNLSNYRIQIFGVEFENQETKLLWDAWVTATEQNNTIKNMSNPASVYCVTNGGKVEIRKDVKGNEYGVCIFVDGSECEEWKYFRGECIIGQK